MEDFKLRMVTPKSIEEQIAIYNATHDCSQMDYKKMTREEIIEKYGDILSEEQIKMLSLKPS